jgi:rubrerythrin
MSMSIADRETPVDSEPSELGLLGAIGSPLSRFRCPGCGYGATSPNAPERCPMCGGAVWDTEPWRPFTGMQGES